MQATRHSSRALRHIAAGSKQTRSLHMTGPATFPSPALAERPVRKMNRDVEPTEPVKAARQFNTSRSLKTTRDTSTLDFAYLPDFDPDMQAAPFMRVPILPQTSISKEAAIAHTAWDTEEKVMLPTILTVAGDSTHIDAPSAMSDVSDNGSIDFQGMAAKVANKLSKPVEESASMARQLWASLVDDVLGPKSQGPARA